MPRRFITYLSIAFNYHFHGLNVFGYHLFNLAVHLLSAFLVWWLALLTFSTPMMKEQKIARHANLIALFAGLIFVAHPIQTEAVTFIVQRAASMATMFYLASLCFYIKSRTVKIPSPPRGGLPRQRRGLERGDYKKHIFYYICSLLTAVLAMFTKETAITLPLMILLYEFCFLKTKKNFNWGYLSPFLLTILIIPVTMYFTESAKAQLQRGVLPDAPPGISSMHYLFTQFRVLVSYIRMVFLPLNQNLDYDYPISKSILEIPTLISFLFLIGILVWAKYFFSKYRLVSFSIFWFFLTLLPESSFLAIRDVIFEHRLYLPMVGYCLFLVSGLYYLLMRHSDPERSEGEESKGALRSFASLRKTIVILVVIVAVYSILTYQRNKVWQTEFSLWDDAALKAPHKARPYYNRGLIYYQQNKFTQAIADYTKAIEIDSRLEEAYYNRGIAYAKQSDLNQAVSDYNKAININFNKAEAYINRGLIFAKQNKLREAFFDFTKAIEIDPKSEVAYNNLGIIYAYQGYFAQALANYARAIELNPQYAETYWNRAVTFYHLKKYDEAWRNVHKAKKLGFVLNLLFINDLKKEKADPGEDFHL